VMSKQVVISQKGVTFLFGRKVTFLLGTNIFDSGFRFAPVGWLARLK